MSESKHTPGPWLIENPGCEKGFLVMNYIGTAINHVCVTRLVDLGDEKANARLIAAAPEMLEMLEEILADGGFRHLGMVDLCRTLIAKAKGVQP